jgi:hypothetical protein
LGPGGWSRACAEQGKDLDAHGLSHTRVVAHECMSWPVGAANTHVCCGSQHAGPLPAAGAPPQERLGAGGGGATGGPYPVLRCCGVPPVGDMNPPAAERTERVNPPCMFPGADRIGGQAGSGDPHGVSEGRACDALHRQDAGIKQCFNCTATPGAGSVCGSNTHHVAVLPGTCPTILWYGTCQGAASCPPGSSLPGLQRPPLPALAPSSARAAATACAHYLRGVSLCCFAAQAIECAPRDVRTPAALPKAAWLCGGFGN